MKWGNFMLEHGRGHDAMFLSMMVIAAISGLPALKDEEC